MTARALSGPARAAWPWVSAASSGVLLSLCFPGWNQGWLCWIALTPLICALWFSGDGGRRPWLKMAGLGFCAGVVFFSMTFSWLTTVTGLMTPHLLGNLAWFGLMCYMALYFALWGWFAGCIVPPRREAAGRLLSSRHNLWLGAVCAAAWVAQEWLRGVVFSGFGWNNIGVALHDNLPLIQVADITGAAGLSFLLVLCNVIAVVTVRRFALEIQARKFRPHFDFTLTVALVGVVFIHGVQALRATPWASIPLRVAAIQPNIPQDEKSDSGMDEANFAQYRDLSDRAMRASPDQRPQLLIWPEAATPMYLDETHFNFVTGLATKIDTNFLLGTLDSDDRRHLDYNIAALIPKGAATIDEIQTHRKMHLVPFGEYIPLRHAFPLFARLAGELVPGDFEPGTEYNLLQTQDPPVKIGALICFEDTLGDLTRHFVLNGAQLLVNVTNDGWFLKSVESEQHLAISVFRAVENRRPLVRCANTGVTCFIDSKGIVDSSLRSPKGDPFLQGFLRGVVDVPVNAPLTFYARHGEWLSYCSLILALGVIVAHFIKRRRA